MLIRNAILFIIFFNSISTYCQAQQPKILVPNLVGMTLKNAKQLLHKKNLKIAAVITFERDLDSKNLDTLIAYKQNPMNVKRNNARNFIKRGATIDVWVTKKEIFKQQ